MDLEIYVKKEFADLLKEVADLYEMPISRLARLVMTSDDVKNCLEFMRDNKGGEENDRRQV